MIDLRKWALPNQISDGERWYEVDTSFRTWIEFERILREENVLWPGIFKDGIPEGMGWYDGALEFFESKNATPNFRTNSRFRTIDFIKDGDYIVASFQSAYGIDLTVGDMHWHRFKALLIGLPDSAMLSKIIEYRAWTKSGKKYEDKMADLHRAWTLPEDGLDAAKEELLAMTEQSFPIRNHIY